MRGCGMRSRRTTDWLFKHTGDGVCAAFASPSAAVAAAIAAQRALELPVRMGLATGEAELRDGDYFGAVLNRAARVMAAGHGGQILLDGATAGLISGVDLIGLGARRLRDIANPVDMFQVRAPGLRNEFPPLKTETTPGNLRPPTTSLMGREAELADLETALKAHRLVTLIGVGRRRQDSTRAGGRDPVGRQLPGWGVGRRTGRRWAIPPRCPRLWPQSSALRSRPD